MRPVALLPLVTGCQLLFSVDTSPPADVPTPTEDAAPPPAIARGEKFISRTNSAEFIALDRPLGVDDNDLVLVTIQSNGAAPKFLVSSPSFQNLSDGTDLCGNANWHLWTFAGRFGPSESLTFSFDMLSGYDAFGTTYKNAGTATEIDFMNPANDSLESLLELPAVEGVSEGAFSWMAIVGDLPVQSGPTGMERFGELDNIAVYDAVITNGVIPATEITVPASFCMGLSRVTIEP
jgi:hypothetical protein